MIKIAYLARSFLDYRVPVFAALDELTGGGLHVFYSAEVTPPRVAQKIEIVLGRRSIGFRGEVRCGPKRIANFANTSFRIVYQPGILTALQKTAPDVVIGDGFFQWTSFALLRRLFHGTPIVVCYERTFHTERNAQWYRTLYRKAVLPWVDAMACNGRLSAEYVHWLGMPTERITLGQMVADTGGLQKAVAAVPEEKRLALRRRWGGPKLVFLVVSRLVSRKGVRQLLMAWSQGEPTWGKAAALVVVGDGPERENLLNQTRAAGMRSVYFEGAVDYDHIAPYYAAADALVMPTLEDNWSLVVPEAMACGLPILCSKYNGCWPELVQERNGWVFDPLDPQDTLRVLQACIRAAPDLPQMGRESQKIISGHTPRHAAESIFAACKIALSRHPQKALLSSKKCSQDGVNQC
jgi:glycosyltransferase involved in cell wall biosynthesis